ncbi:hypothetical protein LL253_03340 [Sphingobium soli]|uniref:Uncharacterized protein n=1 Tax=Sphingobium soli TaxID=1591116 RepID=A0ABS8H1V2_9SPHN|nr:hypothetical protein [Sphingobium soli]MCC4231722.1 hypothetical protein [Sphingobium soli]
MMQGEALGALPIGDGGGADGPQWRGPWGMGVRPGLGVRVDARAPAIRVAARMGSKIR